MCLFIHLIKYANYQFYGVDILFVDTSECTIIVVLSTVTPIVYHLCQKCFNAEI